MWTQNFDPLHHIGISALVAAIPIYFLFYALAVRRMKGHVAGVLTAILAILVAVVEYRMPVSLALGSTVYGALYGLFPIGWIVVTAVFLYNVTVKTGQFAVIKESIARITDDRRLQAVLIGFSFGAFLEGAAGFGAPVAIAAGMLTGVGFHPLYAASLCLIANTAPVAFGAIGIPIITAGAVTGLDANGISAMVGRQLPLLSLLVPFWLVKIMCGWKGVKEVWPALLVSGGSFALTQWFTSNFMGPMLPDILSSVISMIATGLVLKVWKPKHVWRFPNDEVEPTTVRRQITAGDVLKAWSPFLILTLFVGDWGIQAVKNLLERVTVKFHFPLVDGAILAPNGKAISVIYTFNWLSAAGTAILLSALLSMMILRVSLMDGARIFADTIRQLAKPLMTIMAVLGFAFLANYSGMSTTMGKALTVTGSAFTFLSPFLGWLGGFITGSDTSANALFAQLQAVTAANLHLPQVLMVAANSSGGVTGKMISPQSIAVAAAAVGLIGKEGELFRFTVKHSLFFAAIIGGITTLEAYVFPSLIPETKKAVSTVGGAASTGTGIWILLLSLLLVVLSAVWANRRKKAQG
ncbi:lactate permease [Collibacillus ludicampi]|uniref:L-lactate permease n=1 Tax=Collibacillus ludicampi TaxID=2771369 RepID=A0AAV4LIS9_9BACL|nr:lactate permease LctP family transporter [Collibacillus ludicampi]GIM47737.1 lactate permease [Collibacillus ludicampi]